MFATRFLKEGIFSHKVRLGGGGERLGRIGRGSAPAWRLDS
jgi:hypothetical protein